MKITKIEDHEEAWYQSYGCIVLDYEWDLWYLIKEKIISSALILSGKPSRDPIPLGIPRKLIN